MESSLQKELERTKEDKEKFVREFSEDDYNDIITGWQVGLPSKKALAIEDGTLMFA